MSADNGLGNGLLLLSHLRARRASMPLCSGMVVIPLVMVEDEMP